MVRERVRVVIIIHNPVLIGVDDKVMVIIINVDNNIIELKIIYKLKFINRV